MSDSTDFKSRQRNSQLPADPGKTIYVGAQNLKSASEAFDRTPIGTPPANCDVRSVYDSRPINAYDGNVITSDTVVAKATPVFDCEFTVREGYVFVVRNLHHWFELPDASWQRRTDVLMSLFLNGAVLPDLVDIPVGVESDALVKTFIIADELNTLRCRLTVDDVSIDRTAYVMFYGNYLLKSTVAAPQQIGNCIGEGILTQPRQTIAPLAPQPAVSTARPIAPAPSMPTRTGPPFAIVWHRYVIAGSGQRIEPIVISGSGLVARWKGYKGSARDLTAAEIVQYRDYINAARPQGVPAL